MTQGEGKVKERKGSLIASLNPNLLVILLQPFSQFLTALFSAYRQYRYEEEGKDCDKP